MSNLETKQIELTEKGYIKLREYLKVVTSVDVSEIVFKKSDGSIRVLNGTRDKDIIGEELFESYVNTKNNDGSPRKEAIKSLPVFDVKLGDWRAFSFDKLISVNGLNIDVILKNAQIEL